MFFKTASFILALSVSAAAADEGNLRAERLYKERRLQTTYPFTCAKFTRGGSVEGGKKLCFDNAVTITGKGGGYAAMVIARDSCVQKGGCGQLSVSGSPDINDCDKVLGGENGNADSFCDGSPEVCEYQCCLDGECTSITKGADPKGLLFPEGCQPGGCWAGLDKGPTGGFCANAAFDICENTFGGMFVNYKGDISADQCKATCPEIRDRNRLLKDASYNPTLEEAHQVAFETSGDLNAGYVAKSLLSPEESSLLVKYIDENDGIKYRNDQNDKLIMARKKSPLEDIIGVDRAADIYRFFRDNTNNAPVSQVWLRKITGNDTYMELHTDKQAYQLKIALNDDYENGDFLVVDTDGPHRLHFETGEGFIHDSGLVHGHMPHSGDKYVLFVICDADPRVDLAASNLGDVPEEK